MRKIFNLAFANIRKGRGQAASFIIIMAICSMLMTMGLVTAFDYTKSFNKKAEQLNAPDFVITVRTSDEENIAKCNDMLESDSEIKEIQSQPVMLANTAFDFGGQTNSRVTAFIDGSTKQHIGKLNIIEQTDEPVDNPIIIPCLFNLSGGYEIGDPCKMVIDNQTTLEFTVAGFYEDIYFSTINTTTMGYILPHDTYVAVEKQLEHKYSGMMYSVNVANQENGEAISLKYKEAFIDAMPDNTMIDSVGYSIVKTSRTLTAGIGSMIIVGFALLLTLIALIVVNFRIKSSIEEDMKNIGALKAMGYTSGQLMLSFMVQFLILGLAGGAIGIACACPAMPILSNMLAAQSGIVWKQLPTPFAIITTLLVLAVAIGAVTIMSAMRIKKIHPIIALRTGIQTHSFKKNHFPLTKTRMPLMACLSLKQLAIDLKQGMLTAIILTIIAFTSVFAVVMYNAFVVDISAFMALGGSPYLHFLVAAPTEEVANEITDYANSRDDVDSTLRFANLAIQYEGNYSGLVYVSDEAEGIIPHNPVFNYDGRFPKHENEVAINGLVAKTLDKQIGDTILVGDSDNKYEYIITGLIQGSNYMGHDMCMTTDGYRRIMPSYTPSVVVGYMNSIDDINAFLDDIQEKYPDCLQIMNFDGLVRSTMSIYTNIVEKIAIAICIVAGLMIWLILYLVINTMLIKRKRDFGIQKTLGFTTRQLILQNVVSIVPVVGIGALIGCVAGYFLMNPFISLLFTSIGICKANLTVSPLMCTGIFVAIIAVAAFIAAMLSSKIRRISPYTLITE